MKEKKITIRSAVACALLVMSNISFADEVADATTAATTDAAKGSYTDNYLPSKERFSFSGFGSLGLMYLDSNKVRYAPYIAQDGGVRDKIDYAYGSILGLQGSFKIDPEWSFTTQVTFKRDLKKFEPNLEWMFIKYQPNQSWSFRVGRMAAPLFVLSDSRLVNYSHTWARPPAEIYQAPFTTFDGADATYRTGLGDGTLRINGFYSAKIEIKTDSPTSPPVDVRDGYGVNVNYEIGALNLHAGIDYLGVNNYQGANPLAALFPTLQFFGFNNVVKDLQLNGSSNVLTNLGISYEYKNWLMSAETGVVNETGTRLFPDSITWAASLAYRYQQFTPYVTYSRREIISDTTSPLAGSFLAATPVGAAVATVYNNNGAETFGAGMRWDFRENMALKLQVEHMKRKGPYDSGYAQLSVPAGATNVPSSVNLISTSLDFVF